MYFAFAAVRATYNLYHPNLPRARARENVTAESRCIKA